MECAVILHNIRSVHNVGSIFRSADGAGASKVFLTGYTPGPLDRFGRPRADLAKVALGAEKSVPWERRHALSPLALKLKHEGFLLLAIEQHADSISLFDFAPACGTEKIVLILGNETRGLSPRALRHADRILEIPMQGSMVGQARHPRQTHLGKESLNVSVAAGIALFALYKK